MIPREVELWQFNAKFWLLWRRLKIANQGKAGDKFYFVTDGDFFSASEWLSRSWAGDFMGGGIPSMWGEVGILKGGGSGRRCG